MSVRRAKSISAAGEDGLLRRIAGHFRFPSDKRLLLGPGDDCAVLRHTPGRALVITTDEMVEGTHFLMRFTAPEDLAAKLMRSNVSDLAAMGDVRPVSCVAGAGLRKDLPLRFVHRFLRALKREALRYGISVAGGNLAGARENHFYLTVWGEARAKGIVRRGGAAPRDGIFSVGPLGMAAAGLEVLMRGGPAGRKDEAALARSFWRPEPMLAAGAVIGRRRLASAMLDNSDGLARSAAILSGLSGCRAVLDLPEEACSPALRSYAARRGGDWRGYALRGGEDFGLVFTARPGREAEVKRLLPMAVRVGRMEKGSGLRIEGYGGKTDGYGHF